MSEPTETPDRNVLVYGSAVERAEERGHVLEWDPPGLSSAERWTCKNCGRAAIHFHGNIYGSAVTDECDNPRAEGGGV